MTCCEECFECFEECAPDFEAHPTITPLCAPELIVSPLDFSCAHQMCHQFPWSGLTSLLSTQCCEECFECFEECALNFEAHPTRTLLCAPELIVSPPDFSFAHQMCHQFPWAGLRSNDQILNWRQKKFQILYFVFLLPRGLNFATRKWRSFVCAVTICQVLPCLA